MSTTILRGEVASNGVPVKLSHPGKSFVVIVAKYPIYIRKDGIGDFVLFKVGEGENNTPFDYIEVSSPLPLFVAYEIMVCMEGTPGVNIPAAMSSKIPCNSWGVLVPGPYTSLVPPVPNQPLYLLGRIPLSLSAGAASDRIFYRRKSIVVKNNDLALNVTIAAVGRRIPNTVNAADRYQWFDLALSNICTIAPGASSAVIETDADLYLMNNSVALPAVNTLIDVAEIFELE